MPLLYHDLFPRQNAGSYGPSGYDGPYNDQDFELHARLLGTQNLNKQDDTLPSVIFFLAFLGTGVFSILRWRSEFYRTNLLISFSQWRLSCFSWASQSVVGRQMQNRQMLLNLGSLSRSLIIAHCLCLDVSIVLLRNTVMSAYGDMENRHYSKMVTNIEHVLLYIAGVLQVVGFVFLPSPGSAEPPSDLSTHLRLAGAWVGFFIVIGNFIFAVIWRITVYDIMPSTVYIWMGWNFLMFLPAFYNFVNVAVTDDSSPLVHSKALFYVSFGLFHFLYILWLAVVNLGDRWAPRMRPYFILR
ncbi:hypothetical protein BT69DRAFT_8108 [Atractiella rhizophila]|nr:hypothetical protein BT69DRAFT_8108 [Atractiella rhizophila]